MVAVGTRRMRAAELRANRRRPSAVRSPQHRGRSGAFTVCLAIPVAQSSTHTVVVGPGQMRAAELRAICCRQGTVHDPRRSVGGGAAAV